MGYVGFIFGVFCGCDGTLDLSSLLHARPRAATIAAPAMHASVRISVFFIGAFSPTIAVDYFSPKIGIYYKKLLKISIVPRSLASKL
jgi:hypothetical protein